MTPLNAACMIPELAEAFARGLPAVPPHPPDRPVRHRAREVEGVSVVVCGGCSELTGQWVPASACTHAQQGRVPSNWVPAPCGCTVAPCTQDAVPGDILCRQHGGKTTTERGAS